jgi:hypothetical protein
MKPLGSSYLPEWALYIEQKYSSKKFYNACPGNPENPADLVPETGNHKPEVRLDQQW